jgi:transposase-like protein
MISHFQRAGRRDELAYSTERRAAVLKKLEPPNAVPLRQLAKDEGISEATLHTWRRDARSQGRLLPDADAGPDGWTSRDKFAAVLETAALNEVDLAAYCRQRGLYAEQIQTWRAACEQANDWARASSQRLGQATKDDKKQIKALERDLARKEKALAEAAALLVLRKNAAAIWGDGEDA